MENSEAISPPPYLVIRASTGWANLQLRDIWRYRELFFYLAWRDVIIRYKQTVVGVAWALVQPVMSMIIFSLIFGGLAQLPSDGIPYPIFNFTAMVPWTLFSGAFARASLSLITSGPLITKIYFPRLIIPTSTVIAGITDFIIALVVLIIMLWFYVGFGQPTPFIPQFLIPLHSSPFTIVQIPFISINWLWLPYLTLILIACTLGISLWFSAMMVRFRDVRFMIPFIIQVWLYVSPVVYPSSMIENTTIRSLYSINPMSGVIDGFRWALLGTTEAPFSNIAISSVVAFAMLLSGALYFRRQERSFADVI